MNILTHGSFTWNFLFLQKMFYQDVTPPHLNRIGSAGIWNYT
ncbi:hypothetical protein [Bacteroides reticulotermitis]|uniref:Uncharacterized protein n=1 Tax=Bacteroides reticulotermitis TaxID=1133319 RepID=A0A840D3N9_9BACE|nr:hypothetical protein [Bacteroides reticulotermitis]MBB4043062.1 hypothetical protein [Bacteroides reticulotermitis]